MEIGDIAPDFELESESGEKIRLSAYLGKKKIILFFYVKDNTPGCTAEVKGIRDSHAGIEDRYEIFGINQDSKESHMSFCKMHNLPFKILSDPGKKVASKYDAKGSFGIFTKRITYLISLDGKIENKVEGMKASTHIDFIQSLVRAE